MFKVISAEIKKIVSKPGIYILSVLLAVILILGVSIYKPTISNDNATFELTGTTYVQKYTEFIGGTDYGKKAEVQTNINNAIKSINNYSIQSSSETYSYKEYIQLQLNQFKELYADYQDCAINSYPDYITNTKNKVVSSLENLNATIEKALISSQEGSFPIITSKDNYNDYKKIYKNVLEWAKISVTQENLAEHIAEFENKYKSKFYSSINNFKYPTLSSNLIKTYASTEEGTKLSVLNERLDAILLEIETTYTKANESEKNNITLSKKMDELANLYANTANNYVNLVKYELLTNAFSYVSSKEQLNTLYLADYSKYNAESLLLKYDYLFDKNKTVNDFSNPLTIGVTSNNEINAYDYAYFVLKLFSFVIIVYAVMAACHSIAGEIKEGSMRYLAMRPVSRNNLFFGKWFTILIMSTILILFSAVIALCVGGAVYGFTSKTILTIFNGTTAITLHPLGMIVIYLISMLLELAVYSILAMLLSTLFKSDLLSVTIMLVLYLLNTLLPMFIQGSNTWLAFYPFSHISLYSLFGSSVYANTNNFFNIIFGAKVYAGSHIALTISMIVLVVAVISTIAIKAFKKKEL